MTIDITPAQCRAARGLLGWTQQQTSEATKVSSVTIRDFEKGRAVSHSIRTLLRWAFEKSGVEFNSSEEKVGASLIILPREE